MEIINKELSAKAKILQAINNYREKILFVNNKMWKGKNLMDAGNAQKRGNSDGFFRILAVLAKIA